MSTAEGQKSVNSRGTEKGQQQRGRKDLTSRETEKGQQQRDRKGSIAEGQKRVSSKADKGQL